MGCSSFELKRAPSRLKALPVSDTLRGKALGTRDRPGWAGPHGLRTACWLDAALLGAAWSSLRC